MITSWGRLWYAMCQAVRAIVNILVFRFALNLLARAALRGRLS